MDSKKPLILDANILIRAILGVRVADLMKTMSPTVRFFTPEICVEDAKKYLPIILEKRGIDASHVPDAIKTLLQTITILEREIYSVHQQPAENRMRHRDIEDWTIVACALLLDCPIWTEDKVKAIKAGLRFSMSLDVESDGFYGALLRQTFAQAQTSSSEAALGSPAMTGEVPFCVQGEPGLNSVSIIPLGQGEIRQQPETDDVFRLYAHDTARKVIVVLQYYQDNMIRLKPFFESKFDLTKTESEIAFGIMKGYSHKEYEALFGRKVVTAKKHLRHIYKKTGVNEKGKLVALLHHHKRSFDLKDTFE